MSAVNIGEGLILIKGMRGGRFPYSNSLLVRGGRRAVLIDAGAGLHVLSRVKDMVDAVVITHLHVDHFSNLNLFRGRKVYVPEEDSKYTSLEELAYRYAGYMSGEWLRFVKGTIGVNDPFYTDVYSSGDRLNLGGVELEFLHTPGHTRSHHVVVIDGSVVHGGDIDLTSFGPWFGHVECDVGEFLDSIVKVASLKPRLYISGHRDPVSGVEEVISELISYVERLEDNMKRLLDLLETPRSVDELIKLNIVYRKKPYARRLLDYWEENMIRHMLEYMRLKGVVEEVERDRWVRVRRAEFSLGNVKRRILNL